METLGLYIHIPFCERKCNYCDFYSLESSNSEAREKYVSDVINTIDYWKDKLNPNTVVDTVYFGGGTPSILGDKLLADLIENVSQKLQLSNSAEITTEVNPNSVLTLDLEHLKKIGLNRISMGLQSSDDNELAILGRIHTSQDALRAIDYINKVGINNISLDVMTGIPLQTVESLNRTLDFCIDSGAQHISTYMLKIEKDTHFYKNRRKYTFADEDTQADFYEFTADKLQNCGYRHYEISNFCKDNMISRHNMKYWQLDNYLGIGPSAHSMIDGKRFYYPRMLTKFKPQNIVNESEGNTSQEYLMLSLRTDIGFEYKKFEEIYKTRISNRLMDEIKRLSRVGLIDITDYGFRLTNKGFLVSNSIITLLLTAQDL